MLDYKRILMLHYVSHLTGVEIAKSIGSSKTTVNEFLKRFREYERLSFPLKPEVTNEIIESMLYRIETSTSRSSYYFVTVIKISNPKIKNL